jgi:hypothetical protein
MAMNGIEKKDIWKLLGNDLFNSLLAKVSATDATDIEKGVIDLIKKYIANRIAFVFHNANSNLERAVPRYGVEYKPLFRPLYITEDQGNFYEEQSKFYMQELISMLNVNATALSYTPVITALGYNDWDKQTFFMLG